jgi:hypothetical protein
MSDQEFSADDFVYVDPDLKVAICLVEWDKDGNAKPREWPRVEKKPTGDADDSAPRKTFRKPKVRYYPWGSYKTMCKLYKLQGKVKDKEVEDYIKLDEAISKLEKEPYWN